MDARDVLGLGRPATSQGAPASVSASARARHVRPAKPKGMSREAFALLGGRHSLVASAPPLGEGREGSGEGGVAGGVADGSEASGAASGSVPSGVSRANVRRPRWRWLSFSNEARSDSLRLSHWERCRWAGERRPPEPESAGTPYRFARLGRRVEVAWPSGEEWRSLIAPSETWDRRETEYLLALAGSLELRWPVVADRYDYRGFREREREWERKREEHEGEEEGEKAKKERERTKQEADGGAGAADGPNGRPRAGQASPAFFPPGGAGGGANSGTAAAAAAAAAAASSVPGGSQAHPKRPGSRASLGDARRSGGRATPPGGIGAEASPLDGSASAAPADSAALALARAWPPPDAPASLGLGGPPLWVPCGGLAALRRGLAGSIAAAAGAASVAGPEAAAASPPAPGGLPALLPPVVVSTPAHRTLEDLKERYYDVARQLLIGRKGGIEAVANAVLVKAPYSAAAESERRRGLAALLAQTTEGREEEETIIARAAAIERKRDAEARARRAAEAAAPAPAQGAPGGVGGNGQGAQGGNGAQTPLPASSQRAGAGQGPGGAPTAPGAPPPPPSVGAGAGAGGGGGGGGGAGGGGTAGGAGGTPAPRGAASGSAAEAGGPGGVAGGAAGMHAAGSGSGPASNAGAASATPRTMRAIPDEPHPGEGPLFAVGGAPTFPPPGVYAVALGLHARESIAAAKASLQPAALQRAFDSSMAELRLDAFPRAASRKTVGAYAALVGEVLELLELKRKLATRQPLGLAGGPGGLGGGGGVGGGGTGLKRPAGRRGELADDLGGSRGDKRHRPGRRTDE